MAARRQVRRRRCRQLLADEQLRPLVLRAAAATRICTPLGGQVADDLPARPTCNRWCACWPRACWRNSTRRARPACCAACSADEHPQVGQPRLRRAGPCAGHSQPARTSSRTDASTPTTSPNHRQATGRLGRRGDRAVAADRRRATARRIADRRLAKAVSHPDANVRVLYEKFLPEDQRPQKLGNAITADEILALAGDANRGRMIFFKSSAAQCKRAIAVQGFGEHTRPRAVEHRQEVRTQGAAGNDSRSVEGHRAGVRALRAGNHRRPGLRRLSGRARRTSTSCSRTSRTRRIRVQDRRSRNARAAAKVADARAGAQRGHRPGRRRPAGLS